MHRPSPTQNDGVIIYGVEEDKSHFPVKIDKRTSHVVRCDRLRRIDMPTSNSTRAMIVIILSLVAALIARGILSSPLLALPHYFVYIRNRPYLNRSKSILKPWKL